MKALPKKDFPVEQARRFLEPGPIVLLSTAWRGQRNLMTMGWHMVMGFSPSLVATYLWDANHSHALAHGSGECVINVPGVELLDTVVDKVVLINLLKNTKMILLPAFNQRLLML